MAWFDWYTSSFQMTGVVGKAKVPAPDFKSNYNCRKETTLLLLLAINKMGLIRIK